MAASPSGKRAHVGDRPAGTGPANPHGAPDGVESQSAWRTLLAGMTAYVRARREFAAADARQPGPGAGRGPAAKGAKVKTVQGVWALTHPPTVDPTARVVAALHARGVTRVLSPPLAVRGKARLQAWAQHALTSVTHDPRAIVLPLLGQYTSPELDALRTELGAVFVAGAKPVKLAVARRQASLPLVVALVPTPTAPHTRDAFGRPAWARVLTLWPERAPPPGLGAFASRRARELGLGVPPGAPRALAVHINAFLELRAAGAAPPSLPWGGPPPCGRAAQAAYGLARFTEATPTGEAAAALRSCIGAPRESARAEPSPEWHSGVFARHLWWHALQVMGGVRLASDTRRGAASADALRVANLQAVDASARAALARGGSGVTSRGIGLGDDLMRAVRCAADARLRLGLAAAGEARRARPGLHPGIGGGMRYRGDLPEAVRTGSAARNNARLVWTRVLRDTGGLLYCPDLRPSEHEVNLACVTGRGAGPALAERLAGMCAAVGAPAERWGGRDLIKVRFGAAAAAHI